MSADPGANLGNARVPTQTRDVGHVALSFSDSKRYNTLRIRPSYRISLRLGDVENLFLHPADTKRGRMERMQVLGLFYLPLHHRNAETAFDGEPATDAMPGTMGAWEHYKTRILGVGKDDDDAADRDIQMRLKKWIIQTLNGIERDSCYGGDRTMGGGQLPSPAEEDEDGALTPKVGKGNFAKIRVPGGYTFMSDRIPCAFNHDPDYPLPMEPDSLYDAQEWCCQDNPALGALPLVAKVEVRDPSTGEWKPAEKVAVYFQLLEPYDLPAFDGKVSPSAQIGRPPLRETDMQTGAASVGPAKHDAGVAAAYPPSPGDPQVDNCPVEFGGKRGLEVAGNLFELTVDLSSRRERAAGDGGQNVDRPGFYAEHADPERQKRVKAALFEKPTVPAGSDHPHAVMAFSNKSGEAGAIFRPSLAGGERYRIRAYVGAPTLEGPAGYGAGIGAVMVETGTLVVWRNLRISRILKKPYADINQRVVDGVAAHYTGTSHESDAKVAKTRDWLKYRNGLTTQKADGSGMTRNYAGGFDDVGYGTLDFSGGRMKDARNREYAYDSFTRGIARSFCELDFDGAEGNWYASPPEATEDWREDWERALTRTKALLKSKKAYRTVVCRESGKPPRHVLVDVDRLFDGMLTFEDSFGLLPIRLPTVYNVGAGERSAIDLKDGDFASSQAAAAFDSWFDEYVLAPFVSSLSSNGYLPGLTILQFPTLSVWHSVGLLSDYSTGLGFRACILWGGADKRPGATPQELTGPVPNWDWLPWYYKAKRPRNTGSVERVYLDNYSDTSLLLHELGHCMFHRHAPPYPTSDYAADHDPVADGYCVMAYLPGEGDYCARCVNLLRGWRGVANMPAT